MKTAFKKIDASKLDFADSVRNPYFISLSFDEYFFITNPPNNTVNEITIFIININSISYLTITPRSLQ